MMQPFTLGTNTQSAGRGCDLCCRACAHRDILFLNMTLILRLVSRVCVSASMLCCLLYLVKNIVNHIKMLNFPFNVMIVHQKVTLLASSCKKYGILMSGCMLILNSGCQ